MNDETARALHAINRAFYRDQAAAFCATRGAAWPGWERLLELVAALGLEREIDVLDVGCGNGRFAAFLAEQLAPREAPFRYLGIDASPELLDAARAQSPGFGSCDYQLADFVETPPQEALPRRHFSLVVLFGVLHCVPGREHRRALLGAAAERLRPGGLLALTAWRFEDFPRFREKLLSWEEFNAAARPPIDLDQLEPGDRLLPWGEGGRAVRFCHFADEREMAQVLGELPLQPVDQWCADGREGELNRYFVLRAG
jgi:SAM-dependent methyltransferase